MSLESKIDKLTATIEQLIAAMESSSVAKPKATKKVAEAPKAEPTPEPVAEPTPEPVVEAASEPAPVQSDAPFSDAQGLTTYVMARYKALGAEKGAQIQTVLSQLGYNNINDVKAEHYGDLYKGCEAIQ